MATKKLDYNGLQTLVTAIKSYMRNNYLSLNGGTMLGNINWDQGAIGYKPTDHGRQNQCRQMIVTGGTVDEEWSSPNAKLCLHNYDSEISAEDGGFCLQASDGTNIPNLWGKPNGELTWSGKTPSRNDNSIKIATTAFVKTQPIFINASSWEYSGNGAASTCEWGTLTASNNFTNSLRFDTASGGGICFADNSGKTSFQVDGMFYQNEGRYKVLDSSTLSGLLTTRTISITMQSNKNSYVVNAPAVSGYTFCCWTHVVTINWVASGYMNSATDNSSTLWVSTSPSSASLSCQCIALYYRSSW